MKTCLLSIFTLAAIACGSQNTKQVEQNNMPTSIDIQGHRGCRGLLPENSIKAFTKAMDLGVSTLELDVVLSKDHELIVSHEPWMSHKTCLTPAGESIPNNIAALKHNIYEMKLGEVQSYICGSFPHVDYPIQESYTHAKPTLKEVVYAVRAHAGETGQQVPFFNIEIKSEQIGDDRYHPGPTSYARSFLKKYFELNIQDISTVQCFDERLLEALHKAYPDLKLIYLTDKRGRSLEEHLKQLSFKPFGFSPNYKLVHDSLARECAELNLALSVWTVNEAADIQLLLDRGVKSIITDYPDRAISLVEEKGMVISR